MQIIRLEFVYLSSIYKPSNQNELDWERYRKNYQKKLALHNWALPHAHLSN